MAASASFGVCMAIRGSLLSLHLNLPEKSASGYMKRTAPISETCFLLQEVGNDELGCGSSPAGDTCSPLEKRIDWRPPSVGSRFLRAAAEGAGFCHRGSRTGAEEAAETGRESAACAGERSEKKTGTGEGGTEAGGDCGGPVVPMAVAAVANAAVAGTVSAAVGDEASHAVDVSEAGAEVGAAAVAGVSDVVASGARGAGAREQAAAASTLVHAGVSSAVARLQAPAPVVAADALGVVPGVSEPARKGGSETECAVAKAAAVPVGGPAAGVSAVEAATAAVGERRREVVRKQALPEGCAGKLLAGCLLALAVTASHADDTALPVGEGSRREGIAPPLLPAPGRDYPAVTAHPEWEGAGTAGLLPAAW